jgi:tetratricopeptide (TPR) repeat protein
MANRSTIYHSFILASSLCLMASSIPALAINGGSAVQTNAEPTKATKAQGSFAEGQKVEIPITGSRWSRKADYREQDKQKAAADEAAAKKGVDDQKAARQAQIDYYKQIQQMSVDANNQGVSLGKQGRWVEAITAHEKACKYDPNNSQFKINLSAARTAYGQILLSKGSVSEACSLFRKAMVAAPDNSLAVRNLVAGIKKAGYDPSNGATRIKLGDQLKDSGDLQGASIEYNAALQLDPSAKTYIKMGDLSYSVGQVAQAANWYHQAIIKDPDCGAAHRQIGFLQMAAGDQTQAAASLRKALILDNTDSAAGAALVEIWRKQVAANPSSAEHHLGLATALQLTNDFTGAESEYRQVEAIEPNNPGLALGKVTLGKAYAHARAEKLKLAAQTLYGQGLKNEALIEIAQAVRLEPRNAGYQFMYGECLEAAGDYRDAHQAYLMCVLIDPEHNVEAAARAKRMETKGNATPNQIAAAADRASKVLSDQYSQQTPPAPAAMPTLPPGFNAPSGFAPQAGGQQAQMPPVGDAGTKNMFEGGSGAPSVPNSQLAFRTHDESPEAAAAAAASPSSNPAAAGFSQPMTSQPTNFSGTNPFTSGGASNVPTPSQSMAITAIMAKVSTAESQQDYPTAISALREAINSDMKNADLHHRLAMDLQSSNELSEAVAEFRIASALAPAKKDFADDFTRAVAANKKSMATSPPAADPKDDANRAISGLNDMGGSK